MTKYRIKERRVPMIKNFKFLFTACAVILACSSMAFADGNAFTPLNFDDVSYQGTARRTPTAVASTTPVKTYTGTASNTAATAQSADLTGNVKMQNSILQLDNALIEIRNELLNYRTKYSEIDAQYKVIKSEREAVKKQVKNAEKRIKEIDRAKEKIRKNMM